MIDDLDRSIQKLLEQELPPDLVSQVEISFATPDDQFPPTSVTLPAIDLFLYDLRENRDLRSAEWVVERNLTTATTKPPPVRMDCSYLVTAWPSESSTTRPQDEHRILGETIKALLRHPALPEAVLQGSLQGQEPPLPATSLQPGRLQSLAEFWQALGGKPKAAFNYVVTISVDALAPVELGPLVIERELDLRIEVGDP